MVYRREVVLKCVLVHFYFFSVSLEHGTNHSVVYGFVTLASTYGQTSMFITVSSGPSSLNTLVFGKEWVILHFVTTNTKEEKSFSTRKQLKHPVNAMCKHHFLFYLIICISLDISLTNNNTVLSFLDGIVLLSLVRKE